MTPGELMEVLENVVDCATEQGCHSEPKGTDELREALQALADVRTLDEWALGGPDRRWGVFEADNGTIYCELLDLGAKHFEHLDSFDAARAAAAAWVRGLK